MLTALRGVETEDGFEEEYFQLEETDDLYWMEYLDQQDERDWGTSVENAFNPGQQRDAEGRWIGGGTGFASQADHHSDAPGWQNPPAWRQRKYGGVIVDDQNRFLLREPTDHFDGYHWTFAKGGLDHESEKPTKAALREVAEETGLKGEILGYVPGEHKILAQGDYKGSSNYYFLMKSDGKTTLTMDTETTSTKWVSYDDAKKLISQTTNPHGRVRDLNVLEAAQGELQKRLTSNVFCKTGPGGGVDATCSPGRKSEARTAPDFSGAKFIKDLPGSTGPKLYKTPDGKQYVIKTGKSEDRLRNEADADGIYRALGVPTPNSGLTKMDGKLVKYSEFIHDAQTLEEWKKGKTSSQLQGMSDQLSKYFVADAVIANWDVIGLTNDNILVKNGVAFRADNGGALKYRAQGGPKGDKFGETVGELQTMKSSLNPSTAKIFGGVTDQQIKEQSLHILANKSKILEQISDFGTKLTMVKRIDSLQDHYKGVQPSPSPGTKATSGKHVVDKIKTAGVHLTHVQSLKLELLNPDGPVNGKLKIPLAIADKMDLIAGQFPGVIIQKVNASKVLGSTLKQAKSSSGIVSQLSKYQQEAKADKDQSLPVTAPSIATGLPSKFSEHGQALMAHVKQHLGSAKLTLVQLQKIGVLNPQGASSGVVKVPKNTHDSAMAKLAEVLPPGTIIKKVNASGILKEGAKVTKVSQMMVKGGTYSAAYHSGEVFHSTDLAAHATHTISKLSTVERQAINNYTGSGYYELNKKMRDCPPVFECVKGSLGTKMKSIQSGLAKAPLFKEPIEVNRGIHISGTVLVAFQEMIKNHQETGELLQLPSFTSTSTSSGFGGNIRYKIKARSGLLVKTISQHSSEHEVIQSPHARYKVVGVDSNNVTKRTTVSLEEVV